MLRAAGLSYTDIGRCLGVRTSTVWKWLNPDRVRADNAKRRAAKQDWENARYEQLRKDECQCGALKLKDSTVCDGCYEATNIVRQSLVEGMWADEWPGREIAGVLGHSHPTAWIGPCRARGWDIPVRCPWNVAHKYRVAA